MEFTFRYLKDIWKLQVRNKFTYLVGDSGAGKSYLCHAIESTHLAQRDPVVEGGYTLYTYSDIRYIASRGQECEKAIVVVDEEDIARSRFTMSEFFDDLDSLNVTYLIVTRSFPVDRAFGWEDVFTLQVNGHYHIAKPLRADDTPLRHMEL